MHDTHSWSARACNAGASSASRYAATPAIRAKPTCCSPRLRTRLDTTDFANAVARGEALSEDEAVEAGSRITFGHGCGERPSARTA